MASFNNLPAELHDVIISYCDKLDVPNVRIATRLLERSASRRLFSTLKLQLPAFPRESLQNGCKEDHGAWFLRSEQILPVFAATCKSRHATHVTHLYVALTSHYVDEVNAKFIVGLAELLPKALATCLPLLQNLSRVDIYVTWRHPAMAYGEDANPEECVIDMKAAVAVVLAHFATRPLHQFTLTLPWVSHFEDVVGTHARVALRHLQNLCIAASGRLREGDTTAEGARRCKAGADGILSLLRAAPDVICLSLLGLPFPDQFDFPQRRLCSMNLCSAHIPGRSLAALIQANASTVKRLHFFMVGLTTGGHWHVVFRAMQNSPGLTNFSIVTSGYQDNHEDGYWLSTAVDERRDLYSDDYEDFRALDDLYMAVEERNGPAKRPVKGCRERAWTALDRWLGLGPGEGSSRHHSVLQESEDENGDESEDESED